MGISSTLGWESTMNPSPDVLLDHMAWRSLSDHQLVLKLAELVVSDERRSVIFMRRWFGESPLYKGKFQELKNAIAAITPVSEGSSVGGLPTDRRSSTR